MQWLKEKISALNPQNIDFNKKLGHAINVIRNMDQILASSRVEHKIQLIGSMFPEKIQFDGENYRTNSYNKVLDWIFQNINDLQNKKTEDSDLKSDSSVSVPLTELFSEPFLKDLELIWRVGTRISPFDYTRKEMDFVFNE